MSTHVATSNPVRSDVFTTEDQPTAPAGRNNSRLWALSGLGAGILGLGTIATSSMVDVVYRDEFKGTTEGVTAALDDKAGVLFAFHSITTLSALLMVVFAAGLLRRLRRGAGDSIAPTVAFAGLLGTAVVSVMGAGLDTEFMMGLAVEDGVVPDSSAAFYNNWIGTIPWVWVLAGLAGLAVYATSRINVVPRPGSVASDWSWVASPHCSASRRWSTWPDRSPPCGWSSPRSDSWPAIVRTVPRVREL